MASATLALHIRHGLSGNTVVGVYMEAFSGLLSLLPCRVHVMSLHTRVRVQPLWSARALRALGYFGRHENHDTSHVDGDASDAGATGDGP